MAVFTPTKTASQIWQEYNSGNTLADRASGNKQPRKSDIRQYFSELTNVINALSPYAELTAVGGTANAITATGPAGVGDVSTYIFEAAATNTGAVTLSVSGESPARSIVDQNGASLSAGDIKQNHYYQIFDNGSEYVLLRDREAVTLAEAAQQAAEGAAATVVAVRFVSVAALQAANVDAAVQMVLLLGYNEAGDTPRLARYRRYTDSPVPTHPGVLYSNDGAAWVLSEGEVYVEWFGAVGDLELTQFYPVIYNPAQPTNNKTAIDNARATAEALGVPLRSGPGNFLYATGGDGNLTAHAGMTLSGVSEYDTGLFFETTDAETGLRVLVSHVCVENIQINHRLVADPDYVSGDVGNGTINQGEGEYGACITLSQIYSAGAQALVDGFILRNARLTRGRSADGMGNIAMGIAICSNSANPHLSRVRMEGPHATALWSHWGAHTTGVLPGALGEPITITYHPHGHRYRDVYVLGAYRGFILSGTYDVLMDGCTFDGLIYQLGQILPGDEGTRYASALQQKWIGSDIRLLNGSVINYSGTVGQEMLIAYTLSFSNTDYDDSPPTLKQARAYRLKNFVMRNWTLQGAVNEDVMFDFDTCLFENSVIENIDASGLGAVRYGIQLQEARGGLTIRKLRTRAQERAIMANSWIGKNMITECTFYCDRTGATAANLDAIWMTGIQRERTLAANASAGATQITISSAFSEYIYAGDILIIEDASSPSLYRFPIRVVGVYGAHRTTDTVITVEPLPRAVSSGDSVIFNAGCTGLDITQNHFRNYDRGVAAAVAGSSLERVQDLTIVNNLFEEIWRDDIRIDDVHGFDISGNSFRWGGMGRVFDPESPLQTTHGIFINDGARDGRVIGNRIQNAQNVTTGILVANDTGNIEFAGNQVGIVADDSSVSNNACVYRETQSGGLVANRYHDNWSADGTVETIQGA